MSNFPQTTFRALVFIFLIFTGDANAVELPEGWRLPTDEDLKGNFIRDQSAEKFIEAKADLNGDGVIDKAYLVKSTLFSGQALLVYLSQEDDFTWVELDRINWGEKYPNVSLAMGISIMSPGRYETACGKGYWECKGVEEPFLSLESPGLNYFKWGSADSVFYWDGAKKVFQQVWLSD